MASNWCATCVPHPTLPILVLSMHDETIYAERMLSAARTATS